MLDPYGVLGISRGADESEIKKAYRSLSKKYHPDNNPGDKTAEERFKQVQAAYEQILEEKKDPYSSAYGYSSEDYSGYGSGFNAGYRQAYRSQDNQTMRDYRSAAVYINNGYFAEALNVLNSMTDRGAKWFYYSAVANLNYGNEDIAREHAAQAVALEPQNYTYQQLLSLIESGASWYSGSFGGFGGRSVRPFGSGSVAGRIFRVIMIIAIIRFLLYLLLYAPVLYY